VEALVLDVDHEHVADLGQRARGGRSRATVVRISATTLRLEADHEADHEHGGAGEPEKGRAVCAHVS
jgi:hypothetical protein